VDYLRQVQRGVDYIEEHLEGPIASADVARHAGISHWHFQRIFKALTCETLKAYIRARRFASALEKLAGTDERVLEIALAAGFDTQESFTRAFKKAFGVTPARYRRGDVRLPAPAKLRIDAEYLRHIHHNVTLQPHVYAQRELRLVGMRTLFFSVDSEKNNIARTLPPLWAAFVPRLGEIPHRVAGRCYGVVRQTAARTDRLEYHAVAEVTEVGDLPAGMVRLTLPSALYAKFTHAGPVARVDQTVNYAYSTWLAQSGMRHTYGADLEIYDARYHPESENSVIEYAIPVEGSGRAAVTHGD
jgi:AraC family transcriptional regulator